jgi:hypothetical protein
MAEEFKIGGRVKISENAMEEAPDPLIFIKSKHAGQEGTYKGDMRIGEVLFAVIEFDDGTQDTIRKQGIEPL